jgi:hypothetical protein
VKEAKAVYERFINGRMRIMGSGADKEWVLCKICGAVSHEDEGHICNYTKAPQGSINKVISDGSTASYYELPENATELQDLISDRDMNAQIGEIFRECYRYGKASHSDEMRGIKKIMFYAKAELERLQKLKG